MDKEWGALACDQTAQWLRHQGWRPPFDFFLRCWVVVSALWSDADACGKGRSVEGKHALGNLFSPNQMSGHLRQK
jgi:hypothetical protein